MPITSEIRRAATVERYNLATKEKTLQDAIQELVEGDRDAVVTLRMYHGSKQFIGDSFDFSHVANHNDRQSDALGVAFYLTTSKKTAENYAGSNGDVVEVDVSFSANQVANLLDPRDFKMLIIKMIEASPKAYSYFMDCGMELNPEIPYYDEDSCSYFCPNTQEEIKCSPQEFMASFGGVSNVFKSRYNYDSVLRTADAMGIVSHRLIESGVDLADVMLSIEGDLYSNNYAGETIETKQKNKEMALLLNKIREEAGIKLAIHNIGGGEHHATIYDPKSIAITKVERLVPPTTNNDAKPKP